MLALLKLFVTYKGIELSITLSMIVYAYMKYPQIFTFAHNIITNMK